MSITREKLINVRNKLLGEIDCSQKGDFDLLSDIIKATPGATLDALELLKGGSDD